MLGDIAMVKVALLTALWSAIYAGSSYVKTWMTPGSAERWSWEKFAYTVVLAFVLGLGAAVLQVTPDEFWAMLQASGYATTVTVIVENLAKAFARKMKDVPPEGEPAPGAAVPSKPANDGGGRADDGDAKAEDPDTIVADALKPLKPTV